MKKANYLFYAFLIFITFSINPRYAFSQTVIERGENYEIQNLGGSQRKITIGGDIANYKDDSGEYKPVDLSTPDTIPPDMTALGITRYYKKNGIRLAINESVGEFYILPKRNDNSSYIKISAVSPTPVTTQIINNKYVKIYKDTTNVEYAFVVSDRGFKILYKIKNATGAANWANTLNFEVAGNITRTGRQIKYNGNTIFTMPDATWEDSGTGESQKFGNMQESISGTVVTIPRPNLTGVIYPVFIDPSLDVQNTGVVDTSLRQSNDTGEHSATSIFFKKDAGTNNRTLVGSFDFSALPSNAIISNATVYFDYFLYNTNPNGKTIELFRMLRPTWVATEAKWTAYKTGSTWTTSGARGLESDYTAEGKATIVMPSSYQVVNANVTTQVQWAQTNSSEIWYWLMHWESSTPNLTDCYFRSTEATSGEKPKLTITYSEDASLIWVATTGNDTTGNGTLSLPYKTIQKGVDVATAGKTVVVRNGTYTDTNNDNYVVLTKASGNSSNWITIKAENKWGAIIDGENRTTKIGFIFNTGHHYIRIEGFLIQYISEHGIHINSSNHDVEIKNNKLIHLCTLQTSTQYGQTGVYSGPDVYNLTITGNWFEDIGRDGTVTNRDHGIYLGGPRNSHDFYIANNVFVNRSSGWCISVSPSSGAYVSNLTIVNNTFHKPNTTRDGQVIFSSQVDNALVQNNIFYQPRTSALNFGASSGCATKTNITIRNNITDVGVLVGNGSGGSNSCSATLTNNTLSTNPLMIDPTGGNYKLQSGSPARDTGFATSSPSTDFDGVTRPYNTNWDKGAYEYSLAPSLSFSAPASSGVQVTEGNNATITYTMTSPNLATMQLFWDVDESGGDGVSIVGSLAEGTSVNYLWDTTGKNGVYYIYGIATDDQSNVTTTYAPGAFTINPAGNTPPVAGDDSGSTTGSTPVVIDLTANDTDSDGIADSTIALATGYLPSYGTLDFHPTNGTVTYTPTDYGAINSGAVDTFRYTVEDTLGAVSNAALVTVTITGVNTAPIANNDIATVIFGRSSLINVLSNDTDTGGSLDSTSVAIVSNAAKGTTSINSTNGTITYTPFFSSGTDSFTYTVRDDLNTVSNTATVTITINSVAGWIQSFHKGWYGGWN